MPAEWSLIQDTRQEYMVGVTNFTYFFFLSFHLWTKLAWWAGLHDALPRFGRCALLCYLWWHKTVPQEKRRHQLLSGEVLQNGTCLRSQTDNVHKTPNHIYPPYTHHTTTYTVKKKVLLQKLWLPEFYCNKNITFYNIERMLVLLIFTV